MRIKNLLLVEFVEEILFKQNIKGGRKKIINYNLNILRSCGKKEKINCESYPFSWSLICLETD